MIIAALIKFYYDKSGETAGRDDDLKMKLKCFAARFAYRQS